MTDALKPCPFCPKESGNNLNMYCEPVRPYTRHIECECGCILQADDCTEYELIAKWNTRAESQRIAELESENQQLRDKNEVLANSVKAMEMRVMKFVNAHYTIEEKLQDNALKESER